MKILFGIFCLTVVSLTYGLPRLPSESEKSNRIVNGDVVHISKIPYQASLRQISGAYWVHMCGATIISDIALLTAAHCVTGFNTNNIAAVVGTSSRLIGGKTYNILNIIEHPAYSPITLENDIAILITRVRIRFGKDVSPIAGTTATVSGYGATSFGSESSSVLLAAEVMIVNQTQCSKAYKMIGNIASSMLCATGFYPSRDACQGDSGGPLVSSNYLIGIVSWGEGCGDGSYPGVYTRVSNYTRWIESTLQYFV